MDFEALKVIWDSQNHEPLYAVNETALHASVRRRNRTFQRRIFWRDVREIGIGLAAGAGFFVFGWMLAFASEDRWRSLSGSRFEISRGDAVMMLAASGLWLFYAGYQLVGRKRQENRERGFESSLRGDLGRTLAQTEYQIQLARSAVWWGVVPVWLATGLFSYVIVTIVPTSPAVLILAAIVIPAGVALDVWLKRRPIKTELLPLKEEFEVLRRKLTEPEPPI